MAAAERYGGVLLYAAPPERIPDLINDVEAFVLSAPTDPILTAILVHYQLIAIHPFRDGNGRVACLAMELLLHHLDACPTSDLNLRRMTDVNYATLGRALHDALRYGALTNYALVWLGLIEGACRRLTETHPTT